VVPAGLQLAALRHSSGEMSADGSPGRRLRAPRRGWSEPLLNAAVLILLIVPPVVALGWLVVDSIFDQL
jgi:hypothetical protein